MGIRRGRRGEAGGDMEVVSLGAVRPLACDAWPTWMGEDVFQ